MDNRIDDGTVHDAAVQVPSESEIGDDFLGVLIDHIPAERSIRFYLEPLQFLGRPKHRSASDGDRVYQRPSPSVDREENGNPVVRGVMND